MKDEGKKKRWGVRKRKGDWTVRDLLVYVMI